MGLIERGKDLKVKVIDSNVATLKDMVRDNVATNAQIGIDRMGR